MVSPSFYLSDLARKRKASSDLAAGLASGTHDAIESLERKDRIRKLVGAAVQHGASERQKLLLHRLRVGE